MRISDWSSDVCSSDLGVDITAIPLAAIDRVEVVTDGSSALYGSDAVGGVANVILLKDYDGALLTGRLGGATDGGDFEQEYNIVGGKRWEIGRASCRERVCQYV